MINLFVRRAKQLYLVQVFIPLLPSKNNVIGKEIRILDMKKRSPSKNKPCPCESGKLYKRCCENKPRAVKQKAKKELNKKLWNKYNSSDLLKKIAGLSVMSINHSKYVRLELLTLEILQYFNSNAEIIPFDELKNELDLNYSSHPAEDPPNNLFTDLITYYGGDYLIFPGISEGGVFHVASLLGAINQWPNSGIPQDYVDSTGHVARLFLNISNAIAQRLNYKRYQASTGIGLNLDVPNYANWESLKKAVTFTKVEMEALLIENSIDPRALNQFLIQPKEIKDIEIESSPLQLKPIYYDHKAEEYIIVAPYNLSHALNQYLWFSAVNMGCMPEVNNAYSQTIWNQTQRGLRRMGFELINDFPFPETDLPILSGLYQFDDDKIAFINLIFDAGEGFNPFDIYNPTKENFEVSKKINGYCKTVQEQILSNPQYENFEALDLTLFAPIGRNFYHAVDKTLLSKQLIFPINELDILFNIKNVDAIDIWKYSIAYESQLPQGSFIYSTLDAFALYRDKDCSFYMGDETKYDWITTQIGYSSSLLVEAKLKTDKHSALTILEDRLCHVQVERYDSYWPIYLDVSSLLDSKLAILIEDFYHPIWIKPGFDITPEDNTLRPMIWQINEALGYWIWQIQDDIKEALKPIGTEPILIEFTLSNKEPFINISRDFTREPNLDQKFTVDATNNIIKIEIPAEIIPYLYGSDNEADRAILKSLLQGINILLGKNDLNLISDNAVDSIILQKAPLGPKKKFYLLDSNDNLLLDNRNLVEPRYIQEYDTSFVLDLIVPKLGAACPAVGVIEAKEDKQKLLTNIVQIVLLPELSRILAQYDSTELLKRLIALNESLINRRALLKVRTASRIECFVSMDEHIKDTHKNLRDVNTTSLALRCIIEHIVAEPSTGNKLVSNCAIDEMLALMHQIVVFGSLGDQVRHDLFSIEMSILPTARIGTEKELGDSIFDPYNNSKTKEHVIDAISAFQQVFPQNQELPTSDAPEHLENAFKADLGISFTGLCQLIEAIAIIGFKQNDTFSCLPLGELKSQIPTYFPELTEDEINAGIDFFSLTNRGGIIKLPVGYEFFDIQPWRFSRRLSLLRKPLLIVDAPDGNDFVYWGSRHLLQSRIYLADQILTNRLRVNEKSALSSALGKIAGDNGNSLVGKVLASIKPKDIFIEQEQFIGPRHVLKNDDDIGDIDILIIDKIRKIVFSLECKNFAPSRNIKEMIEEVNKLYGDDTDLGLIGKHQRRHEWIKDNREKITAQYGIDISDFEIVSLFVTNEDMFTPHLKKDDLEMPFVSSYDIEENGYDELLKFV